MPVDLSGLSDTALGALLIGIPLLCAVAFLLDPSDSHRVRWTFSGETARDARVNLAR
jgi:hypothetical protein